MPLYRTNGVSATTRYPTPPFTMHVEGNAHGSPLFGGITSVGEYYANVKLGGEDARVQIDTGSGTLAVPMDTCKSCKKTSRRYSLSKSNSERASMVPKKTQDPSPPKPPTCLGPPLSPPVFSFPLLALGETNQHHFWLSSQNALNRTMLMNTSNTTGWMRVQQVSETSRLSGDLQSLRRRKPMLCLPRQQILCICVEIRRRLRSRRSPSRRRTRMGRNHSAG